MASSRCICTLICNKGTLQCNHLKTLACLWDIFFVEHSPNFEFKLSIVFKLRYDIVTSSESVWLCTYITTVRCFNGSGPLS